MVDSLLPTAGTNAPRIARFQSGKSKLWRGCHQIVAMFLEEFKEGIGDDATDDMKPEVTGICIAATVAPPTRHRVD